MNIVHNGFTQRDWMALSFIPGVGPNRLAHLWTYLDAWASEDTDSGDLFEDPTTVHRNAAQSVDYHVLRALNWSDNTARAAMLYLKQVNSPTMPKSVLT